jgi:phosphoserine phosphatase
MARERLYMIHGTGPDRVGLVGTITTAVAKAGGNIVDLRQDVLHGLFTIFMVVDLSAVELRAAELKKLVLALAEDTGLDLSVDRYSPVGRSPDKRNMLVVLIGPDRPGIIASISESLGKYGVNIEFAQNVARENLFLMELMVDIGNCTLPLENVKSTLAKTMAVLGVNTIFQTEDVFNKKKRVVLFDVQGSLIDQDTKTEICAQTGLSAADVGSSGDPVDALRAAAERLEGFPVEVMNTVLEGVGVTPATMELLQTLKTMGYVTALATNGFAPVTERLRSRLGLDHAFGVGLIADDDSRSITGEIAADVASEIDRERIIAAIVRDEGVGRDDITVVSGGNGIGLTFDLSTLLDLHNSKAISRENLLGLLGSFGV